MERQGVRAKARPTDASWTEAQQYVLRAQCGDRRAFGEIVRLVAPSLRAFIRHSARGALSRLSDDLAQETFLRMLRKLKDLREPGRLRPWAFQIAANVIFDAHRSDCRLPLQADEEPNDAVEPTFEVRVDNRVVASRALRAVPIDQAIVLVLLYVEGFDRREVAEILGVPVGTVDSRRARGLAAARAVLEAEEESA